MAEIDVFASGEGGYHTYRIPSLVTTESGALLAFCEGRKNGDSDRGDIDLLLKRSLDGGETWLEQQIIWDDGANTCGNPCAVVDRETGTIWLLMTWNSEHLRREQDVKPGFGEDSRRVFVTHSSDDGASWAEPQEITTDVKKANWSWYATGPGTGIQLQNGPHKGRLLIACDHKVMEDGERRYYSHVIYSDDHGQSWHLGGVSPQDQVNECEVVELADGRLMLNMRNYDPVSRTRQVCFSDDGGLTWKDQKFDETLIEPICQASIQRYRWPTKDQPGVILFSNPASTSARWKLKVRASFDEGKTWPAGRILHWGEAAYSSLAALPGGLIGCLYEKSGYRSITFAQLSLDWIQSDDRAVQSPPNLIVFMVDDLGYGDVGCYGSDVHETPHIDALAKRGLRFTDYHSAGPTCTPTRASLLTGLYQQRFGPRFDGPLHGLRDRERGLPLGSTTIAEVLQDAGYATACIGKWHLGYQPSWLPPSHGFDVFRGLGSGDGDHHTQINRWGSEDWWNGEAIQMEKGYTAELITHHSLEFIKQNRNRPFFLYVPHLAIHFPWQGPEDPPHREAGEDYDTEKFGIIPDPDNVAPHVKAMVESVDRSLGAIVATLEAYGISDDTAILFTSDNGGYLHYDDRYHNISSNGPFRGQKGTLYEGGHRVPMIVSWPGRIEPGVVDDIAHTVDLFPTLAALAGVDVEQVRLDGIDWSPMLLHGASLPRRLLFWRAGEHRAIRNRHWKAVDSGDGFELYNLSRDLAESEDLSEERSDLLESMTTHWTRWEKDVNRSAEDFKK